MEYPPKLEIKGNKDEVKVVKKFEDNFRITFSRQQDFKRINYVMNFLKPVPEFRRKFNLANEILLIFNDYPYFSNKILDFVDKTIVLDYHNRLDKICVILVSKDPKIEHKIKELNKQNKDSRIIVPFTYLEILNSTDFNTDLDYKFRQFFFSRDLFAIESPLKSDAYFFGRNKLVHKLYDKYRQGQNGGLFGLRKIGKTSVLFALERLIYQRNGTTLYTDCQNPAIHTSRWNELLFRLAQGLHKKYKIENVPLMQNFDEKSASDSFEKSLRKIRNIRKNDKILLIFDEIEHISFKTSSSEHWKKGSDYNLFWQSLRAISQKNTDLFTFIIAGVNPMCIEVPTVNEMDNPIFGLLKPDYLDFFTYDDVHTMVENIGAYMGLKFESEVFTELTDHYGGHPFLIRQVCSIINQEASSERPCIISKYQVRENMEDYDKKISHYVELVISILQTRYPEENKLLELLATEGSEPFKKRILGVGKVIEHLTGYGVIVEDNQKYYIRINAIKKYIEIKSKMNQQLISPENRRTEISLRRNKIEINLRKIIISIYKSKYGSKIKDQVLLIKNEDTRNKLQTYDINTIFKDHLFFQDLKKLILKDWPSFQNLFNDKTKFETFSDWINKFRVDAHGKEISDEDYAIVIIAANWFENIFDEMEKTLEAR